MSRMTCSRMLIAVAAPVAAVAVLALAAPADASSAPLTAAPINAAPINAASVSAAPAATAPAAVELPAGFRPEGVTSGPGDTYYTGSLADGRIWTGDLSEGTGRQLVAGVTGRALRGMQYDHRSGLLWVVGQDDTTPTDSTGIVLVVNARTGEVRDRIVVPGAKFLNDLVLTEHSVWVTDSLVDRLTRITLDHERGPVGDLKQVALRGPWPTPEGNRANGIRALDDGSLLIDNSTAGDLWQVDRRSGVVRKLAISGVPAGSPGITGGDGLELRGRWLYVVRGSGQQQVSVLKLHRHKGSWSARWQGELTSPLLDVPSTATLVGRTLWAVTARFGVADPATAAYRIVPLPTHRHS